MKRDNSQGNMLDQQTALKHLRQVEQKCSELYFNASDDAKRMVTEELQAKKVTSDELVPSVLAGERGEIPEELQNYSSVLGEMQLMHPFLAGYLSQLVKANLKEPSEQMLMRLKRYKLLEIPYVYEWYTKTTHDQDMKLYLEMLDYLRLLIIEYIENYVIKNQNNHSTEQF